MAGRNPVKTERFCSHTTGSKVMKSGRPVVALDVYEWLPGHGESHVAIRSDGLEWIVAIDYDDPAGDGVWQRELRFHTVSCFYRASFPGPSLMAIDLQKGEGLGTLVEYPESEAAVAWRRHFGNTRPVKHYAIWFLSENVAIQVFACGFTLAQPVKVVR